MKDRLRFLLVLMAVLLLVPTTARAIPIPALDLKQLTSSADVIAVGQVTSVSDVGPATIKLGDRTFSARQMVVGLQVVRLLKGTASSNLTFRFTVPDTLLGYGSVGPTQFGMFFLRQPSSQVFEVANPYYPFLVASPDAPATKGEALDQVIAELVFVAASPVADVNDRVRVISILEKIDTPVVKKTLIRVATEQTGAASVHAVAALLRQNETSVMGLAERNLIGPQQHTDPNIRRTLAFAIRDGVMNAEAVPALTRLLKADDVETRRSAAAALRHVGTEDVIEPLGLGLQDADHEVRYQAVLGLAAVTGQPEWAPSVDLFASNERRFVTYWKDWLKVR